MVESHGDFVTDDSAAIVDAVKKCNPGGKVVFPEGKTYVVGKAMDLTGLRGMDIGMFFLSIFFFGGRGGFKLLILFFFSFPFFFLQIFKDTSNSATIPITGKPMRTNKSFKTLRPSSSWVVQM